MSPSIEDLEIDVESLAQWRVAAGGPVPRLIDCREESEFAYCRIEGAELIPLSRFGEMADARLTDPDQPVVVYCHHGMRSLAATRHLRMKGHHRIWSLRGGIDAWSERIDPAVPRY